MPGRESLLKGQYYANPRNDFWRLVYGVFDEQLTPGISYSQRIEFLMARRLAVWDVLQSCERSGSGDESITNPAVNDFESFLKANPGIRCVCFNGKKARALFEEMVRPSLTRRMGLITLPSSSPAHAIAFGKKLERWSIIKAFLGPDPPL
ncbi:MAG: DNA-deoxyinosine glycosylase [Methanomassiliicoccales archaeon]|nr:DNA-deoxyinosine glycosylase [Methanomassiliicoccales archaeon]